ncbi:glycosyltransferase family 2 protein [Alicyclobacillus tolerans]|uniref:glycosyltransferase family 2 protein n=1 Tax=Alicyclobacillus tolerans TaxID=90970 RepID=UPI003B984B22
MTEPFVSVIMPTFNKLSRLRVVLQSFKYQKYSNLEIIICDDGSTDGTAEYLHQIRMPYPLHVVHINRKGAGAARNAAVSASNGEILIFNDDDMVPSPNFISAHVDCCKSGRVLSRGKRWTLPIDRVENWLTMPVSVHNLREMWKEARLTTAENWTFYALEESPFHHYRFLQSCTSNLAVSRDTFDQVGGFNEEFATTWGAEDTDFGYRAQRIGAEIVLSPKSSNLHLEHSVDSGEKFSKGLKNFQKLADIHRDQRDIQVLVKYVEMAIKNGHAAELFDEQTFVEAESPIFYEASTHGEV